MHLPAQVGELDELRESAVACGFHLARVLAQLGRNERVPQVAVQLLFASVRHDLVTLDDRHAIFGDREPPPLSLLAERDVVVLRAGEVLENVAVALGRHDPKVEA